MRIKPFARLALILVSISLIVSCSDDREPGNIVFSIGEIDLSSNELGRGFSQITTVEINADGITDPELMPVKHVHLNADIYSPSMANASKTVIIHFDIRRDGKDYILSFGRTGDSVTRVSVDEKNNYLVTPTMLGSGEGGLYGSYDLDIGSLSSGSHSIELIIPDDGLGSNGSYRWDGIVLQRK